MKAVASPIIKLEMDDWVALGGQNFGILGAYDGSHPTGFHRAGFEVPVTDYSRRHDPGRPYDLTWGCAGDFAHVGNARLRALHAGLLARLMADDPKLRMIVEFIGQPWPDQPVMYWARWSGTEVLKRYTGKGHDRWSHISWQRSTAYQRAYLWSPTGSPGITVDGEDDMRFVLVDGLGDEPGQVWLSNFMVRRRVKTGWDISSSTYFHPNLFGTGSSLGNGGKVFRSTGDPDLWGVDVATLGGAAGSGLPAGDLRLDVTGTLTAAAKA